MDEIHALPEGWAKLAAKAWNPILAKILARVWMPGAPASTSIHD
jgi:hypothetical protein